MNSTGLGLMFSTSKNGDHHTPYVYRADGETFGGAAQFETRIPSAAKSRIDFATLSARLKACPFKTDLN
jgi:hypothetical protein